MMQRNLSAGRGFLRPRLCFLPLTYLVRDCYVLFCMAGARVQCHLIHVQVSCCWCPLSTFTFTSRVQGWFQQHSPSRPLLLPSITVSFLLLRGFHKRTPSQSCHADLLNAAPAVKVHGARFLQLTSFLIPRTNRQLCNTEPIAQLTSFYVLHCPPVGDHPPFIWNWATSDLVKQETGFATRLAHTLSQVHILAQLSALQSPRLRWQHISRLSMT